MVFRVSFVVFRVSFVVFRVSFVVFRVSFVAFYRVSFVTTPCFNRGQAVVKGLTYLIIVPIPITPNRVAFVIFVPRDF